MLPNLTQGVALGWDAKPRWGLGKAHDLVDAGIRTPMAWIMAAAPAIPPCRQAAKEFKPWRGALTPTQPASPGRPKGADPPQS